MKTLYTHTSISQKKFWYFASLEVKLSELWGNKNQYTVLLSSAPQGEEQYEVRQKIR